MWCDVQAYNWGKSFVNFSFCCNTPSAEIFRCWLRGTGTAHLCVCFFFNNGLWDQQVVTHVLGYNHRTITYTGVSQCFVESSFAKKHYQAPVRSVDVWEITAVFWLCIQLLELA